MKWVNKRRRGDVPQVVGRELSINFMIRDETIRRFNARHPRKRASDAAALDDGPQRVGHRRVFEIEPGLGESRGGGVLPLEHDHG